MSGSVVDPAEGATLPAWESDRVRLNWEDGSKPAPLFAVVRARSTGTENNVYNVKSTQWSIQMR